MSADIPERVQSDLPSVEYWRSRLYDGQVHMKRAGEFKANELNWRIHPHSQEQALTGALTELGWGAVVYENIRTGNLVDGHLRVKAALAKGEDTAVPVLYLDLSEDEEMKFLATLDTITGMAATDSALLSELLESITFDDPALAELSDQLARDIGLGAAPRGHGTTPEWDGMPDYEQEDMAPLKSLTVNFASVQDIERFSRAVNQIVTPGTKSIWYPAQPRANVRGLAYVDTADEEEDEATVPDLRGE